MAAIQIYVAVISRYTVPGWSKSLRVGMSVPCSFIRKKTSCIDSEWKKGE